VGGVVALAFIADDYRLASTYGDMRSLATSTHDQPLDAQSGLPRRYLADTALLRRYLAAEATEFNRRKAARDSFQHQCRRATVRARLGGAQLRSLQSLTRYSYRCPAARRRSGQSCAGAGQLVNRGAEDAHRERDVWTVGSSDAKRRLDLRRSLSQRSELNNLLAIRIAGAVK
jgi:hypothetical protein